MKQDASPSAASEPVPSRRRFLNSAAVAGLAGVGLAACSDKPASAPAVASSAPGGSALAHADEGGNSVHLKPGELDTYYGLWSGGLTGDMRVLGLPSGR